ncbi:MAG: AsmA-like C-terminal region-containing protein [Candidatus Omnitrophota bacterium]
MKAKRRISKKLFALLGLGALVLAAYFHFGLLPGDLNRIAVEKIETLVPFRISFDKALYVPFQGLSLRGLEVKDKEGLPLFSAKRLLLDIKLIPFFREKKIIVNRFTLDAPIYEVLLDPPSVPSAPAPKTRISGQITVPVAPAKKKLELADVEQGPYALLPENVYLEGIDITNGLVILRKNRNSPPAEIVRGLTMRLGFEKPPFLQFNGSFYLGNKPYAEIELRGSWDLEMARYEFWMEAKSQRVPAWFLDFQHGHFVALQSGKIHLSARLKSAGERSAAFRAVVSLSEAKLRANNADYTGKMALDAQGLFNFAARSFENTRGSLTLENVDVVNLSKTVPGLDHLNGKVLFEPDLLTIESLRGNTKKVAFNASGTIRSFKELSLSGRIHSDSSIDRVLSLLPDDQQKALKDFQIRGSCLAVTTLRGSLKKPEALQTQHKLLVSGASVKHAARKIELTRLSAEIYLDDTGYRVQNCRFLNSGKPHSLEAFIPKSPGLAGKLDFHSNDLLLSATYFLEKDYARIEKGAALTRGLTASFNGRFFDFTDPRVDVRGDMEADLSEASKRFASLAPVLKDAGLKGTLKSPFLLKGRLNDPAGWDLQADMKAFPLFLKNRIRLDNFEMQVRMKNRILTVPHLQALAYQGMLNTHGFFDFSKPGTFFDIHVRGNQIRLEELVKDLDPKPNKLAGTAVFQFSMNGYLSSQKTYRGTGAADIRDGYLFQTDLFKQMGEPIVFVRVEGLDNVVFHSASGTFAIREKKIWTDNLSLMGSAVDLSLKGAIGFDQAVDMVMNIRYSQDVVRGAEDAGGIMPFVIEKAEDFISQYKVSGTLKKPQYEKMSLAPLR